MKALDSTEPAPETFVRLAPQGYPASGKWQEPPIGSKLVAFFLPFAISLLLLTAPTARAAAGSETLLKLVPEDMAICLLIEDLRGHAFALLDSPFAKRFLLSRLGKEIFSSPEFAKLRDIEPVLQKNFQLSLAQLRDDILGNALVLAYSPGPVDKPDHERGLLLLEARKAELLAQLLERVIALQKESGEIKEVNERSHSQHKYLAAVGPKTTTFYLRSGAILAVTSEEPVLLEMIARLDNPAAHSPFKGRFPSLDPGGRLLSLWLNPRPYRALLEKQASLVHGAQLVAFNTFLPYWKALDCIGVFVTHRDDCEVTVAVEGRPNDLPPGGSIVLFKPPAPPRDLAGRWPQGAFLTLTGSIDLPGAVVGVSEFMDLPTRQNLRTTMEQKAAAMLGQDVVGRGPADSRAGMGVLPGGAAAQRSGLVPPCAGRSAPPSDAGRARAGFVGHERVEQCRNPGGFRSKSTQARHYQSALTDS